MLPHHTTAAFVSGVAFRQQEMHVTAMLVQPPTMVLLGMTLDQHCCATPLGILHLDAVLRMPPLSQDRCAAVH